MECSSRHWDRFLPSSIAETRPSRFASVFADQILLVTGAGGSIGSALTEALAAIKPALLLLLDSSEGSLFAVEQAINRAYPDVHCESVVGSVADAELLSELFSRFRPHHVFHAAAYKHVLLLEKNPYAALANNALASYTLALSAIRHQVPRLLLISTDKAVHPHSVMGASKRLAELLLLSLSNSQDCRINAIRLGNVIGSSNSVVPLFMDQIQNGLPLTVTHPEVARYFLSKSEAVSAILAAATAPCEGKILLPHLHPPVRVADLARFLAHTYARDLDPSTSLCYTGLRPGEKLTEDVIGKEEARIATVEGPLDVIETRTLSTTQSHQTAADLARRLQDRHPAGLFGFLSSLLPEYVPSELVTDSLRLS